MRQISLHWRHKKIIKVATAHFADSLLLFCFLFAPGQNQSGLYWLRRCPNQIYTVDNKGTPLDRPLSILICKAGNAVQV